MSQIRVRVLERALPTPLLETLVRQVRQLRRRLGTYVAQTTHRSFWLPDRRAPSNPFEEAIRILRRRVRPGPSVGAEYWFYFSDGEHVFRPHFDKDESRWERERRAYWPICTSVLYLSDTGAPTALFEVTGRELEQEPDRWLTCNNTLVWPATNRALIMKGGTYHGVIAPAGMPRTQKRRRASFMTSWWTRRPAAPACEEPEGGLADELMRRLEAARRRAP